MSYQTGTATDPEDLMTQLNTFLTGTPGWTANLFSAANNRAVWSKAGVSALLAAQWDSSAIGMGMIQAFVGDVTPTNQTGYEFTNDSITANRHINQAAGPYPSYHFFEDDDYIHVVVEISTGIYRHFGFGQSIKLGDWVGGMYSYGQYWDQSVANIDNPLTTIHNGALSGANSTNATRTDGVHAQGLPDQVGSTKYLRASSNQSTDDDAAVVGQFFPAGWSDGQNIHFMSAQDSQLNGFKPLIPIPFYQWYTPSAPDNARLMGYYPDVRTVNLEGLNPAQEITVGSDTWVVFPITRKGNNGLSFDQEQSYNFGLAYKKVTT